MPSFDTVCEPNLPEVKNAVENTAKEIATRFDFKGTSAGVELKDKEITLFGDADFQLTQVEDVLRNKLTKREVDIRFLDKGDVQKIGGDKVKQVIKVRNGIETEVSKKIQRVIKDSKIKVQAHSDFIDYLPERYGLDLDVMLECKSKELALLKIREKELCHYSGLTTVESYL
jgi:uncharacterized protein YajQ (UPF0234 family)